MELAGHKCIGFCEFDKFALAGYTSMHLITEEQRKILEKLDLKKRQKEILNNEYRNGEWYAKDIKEVDATSMPKADCWCFGFPCQDISIAGNCLGFQGSRSSLFFAVTKLVRELKEEDKPTYLFIENVKNLFSVNRGFDFARVLVELDEIGYDARWMLLNSKYFGVPQSRERIYIIAYLRGKGGQEILPITREKEKSSEIAVGGEWECFTRPVPIRNATKKGYEMAYHGDAVYLAYPNSKTRRGRVSKGCTQTLDTSCQIGVITSDGRIRRLTPRECFRLQGWPDLYFEKAAFVNSDSQLYKQAGNQVTINVIEAIASTYL